MARVELLDRLDAHQRGLVLHLADAATEADGLHPLSEHVLLHLRQEAADHDRHLLAWLPEGQLAGYAHLDPTDVVAGASAEVVVHPQYRRTGIGRELVLALQQATAAGRLRLWAHGRLPAGQALAESLGYVSTRELWQLRRSLRPALPQPELAPGFAVRTFNPSADAGAWLALNAAAFAAHPEQGSWGLAQLQHRMHESWFDPAGFFLITDAAENLVAFHWTKIHAHDVGESHEPLGEVYVVGVSPQHQGLGLGRAVTLIGLRYLRSRGLSQAMLYVDADNTAAVHTYQRLGFTHWDEDVQYSIGRAQP